MNNLEFIKKYLKYFIIYFLIWIVAGLLFDFYLYSSFEITPFDIFLSLFLSAFLSYYSTYGYDDENIISRIKKNTRSVFIESKERNYSWIILGYFVMSILNDTFLINNRYYDLVRLVISLFTFGGIAINSYKDYRSSRKKPNLFMLLLNIALLALSIYGFFKFGIYNY